MDYSGFAFPEMRSELDHRALNRYAWLTALTTLVLIGIGGLVTSHGAGMAVPDWPNSYGYNMFFFPVSQWMGGILYEHSHRLVASLVGLMTLVLMFWLFGRRSRMPMRWLGGFLVLAGLAVAATADGSTELQHAVVLLVTGTGFGLASLIWPRREPVSTRLRWLGVAAFVLVVVQGLLGGLRVTLLADQIGVVHATLAQLFFVLICLIALSTSAGWRKAVRSADPARDHCGIRHYFWIATALILGQLMLGAAMRHQHAGLAISDFPLAHGQWWPDTSAEAIGRYNQQRIEVVAMNPITSTQIHLQMAHRIAAAAILVLTTVVLVRTRRVLGSVHPVSRFALVLLGLTLVQASLGVVTILTNKSADVATLHVVFGALTLATAAIGTLHAFRFLVSPTVGGVLDAGVPRPAALATAGTAVPLTMIDRS